MILYDARLAQSVERETLMRASFRRQGPSQGCGFDPRIGLMEKSFFTLAHTNSFEVSYYYKHAPFGIVKV